MKKYLVTGTVIAAIAAVFTTATAFADAEYSYLSGRQNNADRHTQYEEIKAAESDEQRDEAFKKAEMGGSGRYEKHTDAEELEGKGVITEEELESIKSYASQKHERISSRHQCTGDMTPSERHEHYAGEESDNESGDSADELVQEGVISPETADSINDYLSE